MRGKKPLHEVVTVQGLPQICDINSNISRRVVWFLIFCGGLSFTTFNIYKQISLYLSVPVNVRVDQILDNTLLFPTITLCNNNAMRRSLLENLGWSDLLQVMYPYTDFSEQLPNVNASQFDMSKILSLQESVNNSYGHVMENTIIKCDWESGPCGQDDFVFLATDMGKCFTYNVNGSLLARNSGRAHGLRLLLNVQEEEYTRSHDGYLGTGFMVAVHAPEVIPIMSEMGIAVAPGSQHFVGIGVKCDWESAPCGQNDFVYLETDMGKCFTYNVNGSLLARNSGRAHGLRLLLNVQEEEYTQSHQGFLGTGFMVAVHAPEVTPIMSEMGTAVAPGFQHFVGIRVKEVTTNDGVGGCGNKPLKYLTRNYSRDACKMECEMDFIASMCKCKYSVNLSDDLAPCTTQQFRECCIPAKAKYLQTDTGCEAGCPEACSYTRFTTQHSSSPLTRNYITAYTKAKGKTEEYWRRNMVILEMYLSSMTYEHMEKQLGYEILDLFCDIGGALGLLLGASLLTVLEVFDFLCIAVFSAVFEKNKVHTIDNGDSSK